MIAELIDNVSHLIRSTVLVVTHTKAHSFRIQLTIEDTISNKKKHEGDLRT